MSHVAFQPPRSSGCAPAAPSAPPALAPGNAFWSHGVCLGASVIAATAPEVDTLSRRIAALPAPERAPRPVVGHYLFMVKTLAAAWSGHSRPALVAACAALMHYGVSYTERDAPLLGAALLQTASGRIEAHAVALRLVDGLLRRLAAPLGGFAALHRDVGSYLAQMAGASVDLETDTVLVTQRMQADHVHAFVLAQHVPLPHDEAGAARLSTRLDQLRQHHNATLEEAAWLQQLLPAVGAYLGAVDRLGVGIHASWSGVLLLREHLEALKGALRDGVADGPALHAALLASLNGWRDLAARLAALAERAP